jgi:hypothetical protein
MIFAPMIDGLDALLIKGSPMLARADLALTSLSQLWTIRRDLF